MGQCEARNTLGYVLVVGDTAKILTDVTAKYLHTTKNCQCQIAMVWYRFFQPHKVMLEHVQLYI